jgi:S-adenosylmethionine:tRNA ribosyltransferase-isomerase
MRVDLFDFALPEALIALRPANPRDSARMFVVGPGEERHHAMVRELPRYLSPGDVLVINDTRVIAARLAGRRAARSVPDGPEARLEATLVKRTAPNAFLALVRPAKRLRQGDSVRFDARLQAVVRARTGGQVEFEFSLTGVELDHAIAGAGVPPLPPYIAGRRETDVRDRDDYQTVYARHTGAVAAPTAGLHFTPDLLAGLTDMGILVERVTLHVGPGTFLPVTADETEHHQMQAEWAHLPADAAARLNAARAAGGRIVAVGSTSLRTLESASDEAGKVHPFSGETSLFITPGYRFRAVDVLMTNFHLPRSTLFMLVAAFSGLDVMQRTYREAIEARYRFFSYGDACLLYRDL